MKTIPYACIQDLQPDGYERDEEPVMCRCGHVQAGHEQEGPLWECIGACEFDNCPCEEFDEEGKDDEF
jgi:hypothetical protein